MRKGSSNGTTIKHSLLQGFAALLLFFFVGNTLEAQLTWLQSDSQLCELCTYLAGEEIPVDDSESEKKEKQSGEEEFILLTKSTFAPLIGTICSPFSVYLRNDNSWVSDVIFPPPKTA
jgi:hypothetical protein